MQPGTLGPGSPGSPLVGGRVSGWGDKFLRPGATLTLAPLCRSASAKALPMPCAAPVTSATLPFTCMVRPLLRAVGELGVSARPQLLWPPARARAALPGALLRVGGDETVKPAPRNPRLCHLALSAPLRGAKLRDLCLPDSQPGSEPPLGLCVAGRALTGKTERLFIYI